MSQLAGSRTEQNLLKAFAGESQARMRYDYFASQAKKEGLQQIAAIFEETALNEKEHAKRFFKFLEGGMVEITAKYPAGVIGTTMENLKAHEERYRTLYNNLEEGKVFKRGDKVVWKCRNCGFLHEGTVAPKMCPACQHDQSYFEIQEKNY